jgi:hypothetical protein
MPDPYPMPEPDEVFVPYAAADPVEAAPGVLVWVRGIGQFGQGAGALLRIAQRYGSLPAMLADLDGYISRRAAEVAAPEVEAARQRAVAAESAAQIADQRRGDLGAELTRRLAAQVVQLDRLRRRVAELEGQNG